jgi:hypothetical protein
MSTRPNSDSALAASVSTSAFFADVGEHRDGLDPEIAGVARDRLSLLLIGARVDHDMRTFAGQLQYRRTADIAPRSGDQRDLPFKLAHAPSPRRCSKRNLSAPQ